MNGMKNYQHRSLLITNDFPPIVSGISTVFYEYLKRIEKNRYLVIAPRVKGTEDIDRKSRINVKRVWIPIGESRPSKFLKTLLNIIYILFFSLRYRPSIIHCGQILSNGYGGFLCRKLFGIPYTVWVYGSETIRFGRYKYLERLMRLILKEVKRIVVDSSFTEKEYLDFGVLQDKIVKLTPGVDTDFFIPMEKNEELIEKYSLKDKTVLLTVGRLDERKGHDMVLEAIAKLIPDYPNILYLIVGKGREEERLKRIVLEKGLKSNVIFTGYVDDDKLPAYYNLCDIFVLPNRITEKSALRGDYEGFGIVFLEAGACEKPVIGGRSGGVTDAVFDGLTGYLVDPLSPEDIAAKIKVLLDNPILRKRMGDEGRDRVVKDFDWRVLIKRFEEIIE
jgi:phosphatidylinositol alpha-1,6-mannosyltransferase